jgi:hypothetical protein
MSRNEDWGSLGLGRLQRSLCGMLETEETGRGLHGNTSSGLAPSPHTTLERLDACVDDYQTI